MSHIWVIDHLNTNTAESISIPNKIFDISYGGRKECKMTILEHHKS